MLVGAETAAIKLLAGAGPAKIDCGSGREQGLAEAKIVCGRRVFNYLIVYGFSISSTLKSLGTTCCIIGGIFLSP